MLYETQVFNEKKKKTWKYATVSICSSEEYKDGILRKKGLNAIETKCGSWINSKETLKNVIFYN